MAITTSFTVCQSSNCATISFNETTGAYSGDNPTGYGAPNDTIVAATSTLIVTLADGSTTTFIPSGFPTVDPTKVFTISASDLGYNSGDQIEDQIISFEYRVITDQASDIRQINSQAFYCQVNCCVTSMFIDLDLDCADCLDTLGDRASKAYLMLKGLEYSAACGNTTTFNKTLSQLQKLCKNSKCTSCK